MANYTKINIGGDKVKVTHKGALAIVEALQLPNGVDSFRDMDMTNCLRMNGQDLEYYTGGQWRKVMSNWNGIYLTETEIDIKIADAVSGIGGDKNFVFTQAMSSSLWVVNHPLNKKCSVTVTDTAGTFVEGKVTINNGSQVQIEFNAPFSGEVLLN